MPLYFAYGSNMDTAAMAVRCPRSAPTGLARLPRHRPAVTRRGLMTVLKDPRRDVWGMLWNLALSDVAALDRYEEVGTGLYAKDMIAVIRNRGAAVRTLIYVARKIDAPGTTVGPTYGAGVVAAARSVGASPAYVAELEKLFRIGTQNRDAAL